MQPLAKGTRPIGAMRSILFSPAVRTDHLEKLASRGADLVVIDCEDATPLNRKDDGRENARKFTAIIAGEGGRPVVRINAPGTPWFADDVTALAPEAAAVMMPMAEQTEQLDEISELLNAAGLSAIGVFVGLETAAGVANAEELLRHPRTVAGYFGAEDYIADVGGRRSESNAEVLFARSRVVMAARLGSVPVADQVVTDFRNGSRFRSEAAFACDLGYRGKLCIHPGQVELANAAFTPSEAAVANARGIIAAHLAAVAEGVAVADYNGQMIDGPLVAQAEQTLERSGESQ